MNTYRELTNQLFTGKKLRITVNNGSPDTLRVAIAQEKSKQEKELASMEMPLPKTIFHFLKVTKDELGNELPDNTYDLWFSIPTSSNNFEIREV